MKDKNKKKLTDYLALAAPAAAIIALGVSFIHPEFIAVAVFLTLLTIATYNA